MRLFWIILTVLAVGYILMAVVVYLKQDALIYYPARAIVSTPDAAGMAYEPFVVRTADGNDITGWFIPSDSERAVLLYCHGNGGNISHRMRLLSQFNRLGLSVCIFDYRGYGTSSGSPSEEGTYLDADAVWNYLVGKREIPSSRIILFGHSLGGGVASHLATEHTPRALILESTFTSMPDIGAEVLSFLPARLLSRYAYDNVANVRRLHVPLLVIHSSDDEMIPYELGRRLFEAANEPKEFVRISGGHDDGYLVSEDRFIRAIDSFISRH